LLGYKTGDLSMDQIIGSIKPPIEEFEKTDKLNEKYTVNSQTKKWFI
jgi:hypothetical protein